MPMAWVRQSAGTSSVIIALRAGSPNSRRPPMTKAATRPQTPAVPDHDPPQLRVKAAQEVQRAVRGKELVRNGRAHVVELDHQAECNQEDRQRHSGPDAVGFSQP